MVSIDKYSAVFIFTIIYLINGSAQETSYNSHYMQIGQGLKPKQLSKRGAASNGTRCYGQGEQLFGCYDLKYPWTSDYRPVSVFPESVEEIQLQYMLFTRKNPVIPVIVDQADLKLEETFFDPQKPIFVVTHGYMEGGTMKWMNDTTRALLALQECNVFLIDWEKNSGPIYPQAVANIRLFGSMVAHFLADVATYTGDLKLDHVHAIGHSLGSHMFGYSGYELQLKFNMTLGRITGMDPAQPHFGKSKPPVRLDRTAAKYVDIIHSDAKLLVRGYLGMVDSIGDVDYYPNGGSDQPGCVNKFWDNVREFNGSFFLGLRRTVSCNHAKSHEYFLESIIPNPNCKFMTVSCSSFKDFTSGRCFGCGKNRQNCIPFGFHGKKYYDKLSDELKQKSRVQYLITGAFKPFCTHHYRITVWVSDSTISKDHGGEVGQLYFTFHSKSDGKGHKTTPIAFMSGFYEPGGTYIAVVGTDPVPTLRAIEVEWKYNSSLLNPFTWRIMATPMIYLKKITVETLEMEQTITVCPKWKQPLSTGVLQLMVQSYC